MIYYNLKEVKPKVIDFIKQHYYDFCSDMMLEIKRAAGLNSIDDVEMFVDMIRTAEKRSEKQIEVVQQATCLAEILNIANDDAVGNALFESEDKILSILLKIEVRELWG